MYESPLINDIVLFFLTVTQTGTNPSEGPYCERLLISNQSS